MLNRDAFISNHKLVSLPGLTPQVGFTRRAAHDDTQLGQARVAVQSIQLQKSPVKKPA